MTCSAGEYYGYSGYSHIIRQHGRAVKAKD